MQITNGTVSRTYRPADFEGRTVTLSFAFDPGDDEDVSLAVVSSLCEKHACQRPGPVPVQAPAEPARQTRTVKKPPVVETTAQVVPEAPAATAEIVPLATRSEATEPSPAPAPEAASGSPVQQSEAASSEISNNDLNAAIMNARQVRHLAQEQIVELRNKITSTPGMSVMQMDQEQRKRFVEELAQLSPVI